MSNHQPRLSIERKPEVLKRTGYSNSTLYARVNQGLFVPPISLGCRAVGWPDHETTAILQAMVSGTPPNGIKQLVSSLIEARQGPA
jgi:prophage regulatory protein